MKSKISFVTLAIIGLMSLFLILTGGMGAFAQGAGACAGDIEKFCQGVQPGGGRMAQCILYNTSNNSRQSARFVSRR